MTATEGLAQPPRLGWSTARITRLQPLNPRMLRVVLLPAVWQRPVAGQHIDLRLTADDGYQAQRSYSLLSPPGREGEYEMAIELLADGEVSPWFHHVAQPGDELQWRGPVGGHFIWRAQPARPTLLVGGGSGVVPLLAMVQDRLAQPATAPMMLLAAARTLDDVLLLDTLQQGQARGDCFEYRLALSRAASVPRPQDHPGRIDAALLQQALQDLGGTAAPQAYVCGRHAFVETITQALVAAGMPPQDIRTERFGG